MAVRVDDVLKVHREMSLKISDKVGRESKRRQIHLWFSFKAGTAVDTSGDSVSKR